MPAPVGAPRLLLRRLREVMAERESAQARLDKVVVLIASNMVAEVCSLYLRRRDGSLELFATEGLNRRRCTTRICAAARVSSVSSPSRRADAVRRRADPSGLLLPARDRRGDLPLLPRRAGPARRPHHRRADGAEPHPASLQRRGGRGAANHRHGHRRDDRLRRPGQRRRRAGGEPPRAERPPSTGVSRSRRAWRSATWCCTSRASSSPS